MAELKQRIESIASHTDGAGKSVFPASSRLIRLSIVGCCFVCIACFPNCANGQLRFGEGPNARPAENGITLQLSNEHSFLRANAEATGSSAEDTPVEKEVESNEVRPTPLMKTSDSWLGFVSNALPTSEPADDSTKVSARKLFRDREPTDENAKQPKPAAGRDPIDLQKTLKKVGSATFLVLAGCCAFLLIARKFGFGQGQDVKTSKAANKSSIKIIETRRLAGRCQLKLIEVDDCRFLVAVDGGGVKSVQSVARSFSDSLNEYAENAAETVDATTEKHTDVDTAGMNQVPASKIGSQVGERLTSLIERI